MDTSAMVVCTGVEEMECVHFVGVCTLHCKNALLSATLHASIGHYFKIE